MQTFVYLDGSNSSTSLLSAGLLVKGLSVLWGRDSGGHNPPMPTFLSGPQWYEDLSMFLFSTSCLLISIFTHFSHHLSFLCRPPHFTSCPIHCSNYFSLPTATSGIVWPCQGTSSWNHSRDVTRTGVRQWVKGCSRSASLVDKVKSKMFSWSIRQATI